MLCSVMASMFLMTGWGTIYSYYHSNMFDISGYYCNFAISTHLLKWLKKRKKKVHDFFSKMSSFKADHLLHVAVMQSSNDLDCNESTLIGAYYIQEQASDNISININYD